MWNAPNILTLGRLLFLPVIVWMIWPGVENRNLSLWAGILYGAAGALDILDGAIARRYNLVTVFGKFLDPLADKLYYLITLIALLQLPGDRVPTWVVMVVLTRELAITGLRGIAAGEGIIIAAGSGGKLKTAIGTLATAALLVHYPYVVDMAIGRYTLDFRVIGLWMTYVSLYFSLSSGFSYAVGFVRASKQKGPKAAA